MGPRARARRERPARAAPRHRRLRRAADRRGRRRAPSGLGRHGHCWGRCARATRSSSTSPRSTSGSAPAASTSSTSTSRRGLEGGGGPDGEHVIKLNYTSLQHPVAPVESTAVAQFETHGGGGKGTAEGEGRLRVETHEAGGKGTAQVEGAGEVAEAAETGAPVAVTALVLPLHGHLAPAAWAAAQASPGIRVGYVQTGGGALPGVALPRRRRAARARSALRPHHRGAGLRRRARGAQHRRRPRRRQPPRLGRGPGRPRSRHHRLQHRVRPRRHGRPRQRPRRPLAAASRPCSPRASPPATPASATATSATTPTPSSSSSSPRSTSPSPRERTRIAAALEAAPGRHRLRHAPVDLDAYGASGLPATTMGRSLQEDPLFFAAPLAAGRLLSASERSPRADGSLAACRAAWSGAPGENHGRHGYCSQARDPACARLARGRCPLRGPRPRLPLLPGAGARPLAQHAERLPHRPLPVRRIPLGPRSRRAARPSRRRRRLPRRAGDGGGRGRPARPRRSTARPPACAPSTSTCAATS